MTARDATGKVARVLAANERFYAAFNAHDIEAMRDCWSRSDKVACVHAGWSALVGHEAVMTSWCAIADISDADVWVDHSRPGWGDLADPSHRLERGQGHRQRS